MAHSLEALQLSYAPAKNRKKQWPTEGQMEGWFPRSCGDHTCSPIARVCGAFEPTTQTEQFVIVPPMLGRRYESEASTRDRRAKTGADARIEEITAIGELRLALQPYRKRHIPGFVTRRSVSR